MTKHKIVGAIAAFALVAIAAVPAQAVLISGTDFSQYAGEGSFNTGSAGASDVLDGNYSGLAPGLGVGPAAAPFGTLYFNGDFGSTPITPNSSAPFQPFTAPGTSSLQLNLERPTDEGLTVNFDAGPQLTGAGQPFFNPLAMIGADQLSVVYRATTGTPGRNAQGWFFSAAGLGFNGTASVNLEYSLDGVNYNPAGSFNLGASESLISASLGSESAYEMFVRLNIVPGSGFALLDNFAVSASSVDPVPEPAAAVLLGLGLTGAALLRRRRA